MDSGDKLGADLSDLMAVAKLDLPDMADTFAVLNNTLGDHSADGNVLAPCPTTASLGPVGPSWLVLRDRLQDYLADAASKCEAAADAVTYIVNLYASTDATAAADLRAVWSGGLPADLGAYQGDHLPLAPPPVVTSHDGTDYNPARGPR